MSWEILVLAPIFIYGIMKSWLPNLPPRRKCTVCQCSKHKRQHSLTVCKHVLQTRFPCQKANTCYLCLLETVQHSHSFQVTDEFFIDVECYNPHCRVF